MKTYRGPMRRRGDRTGGAWYIRERNPATGGRRWIRAGETKYQADLLLNRLREAAARGAPEIEKVTVERAREEFLSVRKSEVAESTWVWYGYLAKRWPGQWAERVMDSIETAEAEEFLQAEMARGVSQWWRNSHLSLLRQFFRWGRRRHYCSKDPTEGLKKLKVPDPDPRILSPDEEEALLRACEEPYQVLAFGRRNRGSRKGGSSAPATEPWSQTKHPPEWLRPLSLAGLRTGLRLGNLIGLRWNWVVLKGPADSWIRIPAAESKARVAIVLPVHPDLYEVLVDLERRNREAEIPSPLVFRAAGLGATKVAHAFSRACKRAGLHAVTFHTLRKTAATRMLQAGVDIKTVMAIGGWKRPDVLLRHYVAPSEESKRRAIAALGCGRTASTGG